MNPRDLYIRVQCCSQSPSTCGLAMPRAQAVPQSAHEKQMSKEPHGASGAQTLFFRAATGNAFTIFLAGFAFTTHIFPKISLLPALVAGFVRVLILNNPGITKTPVLETSFAAISPRLPMNFAHCVFLSSCSLASCSAKAPLVMALEAVFMGAISQAGKGAGLRRTEELL